MNLNTIFIALPIFFVTYKAVELIMESQAEKRWGTSKTPRRAASSSTQSAMKEYASFSSKLGFNKVFLRYKPLRDRLDLLLLRSGYPFGWKSEDFLLCKEMAAIFLAILAWEMYPDAPVSWFLGLVLGFWVPDFYMASKGTARRAAIQRLLPGFIDLSALALESGLDLMAAIERILEKMKSSALKDELASLLQENRLGTPRKEALEHMSYRIHLPDIQSLTSIIIQSEELGTSLASVLRNYAEDMRNRRILRAEEIAGKMPVKMLMPMMIFFFPIVFVIIFGPLALNFANGYK